MKKVTNLQKLPTAKLKSLLRECDACVRLLGSLGMKTDEKYILSLEAQKAINKELKKR